MQDSQAIQYWIKGRANTYVLGLLFVSLLVIYLIIPPSNLVTFLCVTILAMSLVVAVSGQWNELFVLGLFAAIVSLVAAYFWGRSLRFGTTSGIILMVLWGILLFLVGRRILAGIRPVPLSDESPAILIGLGSDRRPYIAPPPLVVPFLQPIVAIIPRKVLIDEVDVENINTQANHDIDKIAAHVRYMITDPVEAFMHTSQSTLNVAAKGKNLDEARLDVTFWENLFEEHLLKIDIKKAVREVVFEQPGGAVIHYANREQLAEAVKIRLNDLVQHWGAEIIIVELDYFKVDGERFRNADPERRRTGEATEAAHLAGMEAERLRQVLGAEVDAEAQRVRAIIEALRESGVEITPDVVTRAIRAASDWTMDGDYTLQPTTAPISIPIPPPKPPADKK